MKTIETLTTRDLRTLQMIHAKLGAILNGEASAPAPIRRRRRRTASADGMPKARKRRGLGKRYNPDAIPTDATAATS